MSFHNELKYYREEILGLSQEEVIKRLHMSQPTLSLYENGKRQITVELLQLFQQAYSIPADYLMKMLFGEETTTDYSPMVLREHAYDSDMQRVLEMLNKQLALRESIVNLTFASDKMQNDLAELLPSLLKFYQNR